MGNTVTVESVREKFQLLSAAMTERMKRQWAAAEAVVLGHGGISLVAGATGLSRTTITAGIRELRQPDSQSGQPLDPGRSRRPGGGRDMLEQHDPTLLTDLELLVEPTTRGDPMSPLRW